jgi:dipeptidase E
MKLLLTSAGIKNTSIHNALVDLLGKPVAEKRQSGADRTSQV